MTGKELWLFDLVAELALIEGVTKINERPGCWEREIDAQWWMAVNGHREPTKCSRGPEVPPFECYVEFNGWPAGVFGAFTGTLACGDAANERTLRAALQAAIDAAATKQ